MNSNDIPSGRGLHPPTFAEKPQFQRTPDGNCIWFGQPCRVLSAANENNSYASICFVHQDVADAASTHYKGGRNMAEVFDAKIVEGMEEFTSHFLCVGLYQSGKLVGLWDLPLRWLEGNEILGSDILDTPEFKALMAAAQTYAKAHPAPPEEKDPPQRDHSPT